MSTWTKYNTYPTGDPRVRIGNWGTGNWRTVVQDEPREDWNETGPPYLTRKAAERAVPDLLVYYFGDGPTRAQLAGRIEAALAAVEEGKAARTAGQLQVVIGRMVRALQGHAPAGPPSVPGGLDRPPWPWEREGLDPFLYDLDISVTRPGAVPEGSGGLTTGETDPYVRITHRPSGITVERDADRSQLQNKADAMAELMRQLGARRHDVDQRAMESGEQLDWSDRADAMAELMRQLGARRPPWESPRSTRR